nr:ORF1a [Mute swan feces associated avastrovius 1]
MAFGGGNGQQPTPLLPPTAFSSLNVRSARRRGDIQLEAGVEKIFNFSGVHDLYQEQKYRFGGTAPWKALMNCDAIYFKDRNYAFGADGTRVGLFSVHNGVPSWSPDAGEVLLKMDEKHLMKAQVARTERYQASLKMNSSLVSTIMEKNEKIGEKIKLIEQLNSKIDQLEKKHQERCDKLVKNNIALMRENETLRQTQTKLLKQLQDKEETVSGQNKLAKIGTAFKMFLFAFVLFWMLTNTEAALTFDQADLPESCDRPEFGCVLVNVSFPAEKIDFSSLMSKCYNTDGNMLPMSAFDPYHLYTTCLKSAEYFLQKEDHYSNGVWCNRRIKTLVAQKCSRFQPFEDVKNILIYCFEQFKFVKENVQQYKLGTILMVIFSIALAGNKEKMMRTLPVAILAYYKGLPITTSTSIMLFLPIYLTPVVCLQMVYPNMLFVTAFTMWAILTMRAIVVNDGMAILWDVSHGLVLTLIYVLWAFLQIVITSLIVNEAAQIFMMCAGITFFVGTRFAAASVTIVGADGSVEKITRIHAMRRNIANQCKKGIGYLQSRGIIPGAPVRTNSVVIVEGKNGTGTGWRFMNWICTAGHVTRGSNYVTIKYENISVKAKVEKEIELFECIDTLILIKLPKELQGVKPLRLAKNITSDYLTLHCYCPNFINNIFFSGWCIIDGSFINNSFNTQFGNSGAPYCDRDGRLVGMHLGSQGVTSQGVVLVDALKMLNNNVMQDQCKLCKADELEKQEHEFPKGFDMDLFLSKVIDGTKVSHQAILKNMEQLTERVMKVEQKSTSNGLEKNLSILAEMVVKQQEITEKILARMERTEKTLEQVCKSSENNIGKIAEMVEELQEQKKKGKTKKTTRGQKHIVGKKFLTKGHFMKMKMLTEEEYRKMLDEGWTADEIRDVVNGLREQAWRNYVIDNDIDEEGEEDWYEDMLEDEAINEEIDRRIEQAMEDMGETIYQKKRHTFTEQALMHIIRIKKNKVKTARMEVQKESEEELKKQFEKVVLPDEVKSGTSVAVLTTSGDVKMVEGKEINWSAIQMIDVPGEKEKELIMGTKKTAISTGPDNKKNILKEKTTDIPGAISSVPSMMPLEQRKKVCRWCGSTRQHNYQACRHRNEKLFCVFCGIMHSENEGHSRPIECVVCKTNFKGIESLEQHVINGCNPKN